MAAGEQTLGPIGGNGLGPFGNLGRSSDKYAGITNILDMVSSVIGFMTIVAGIWFLFMLLFSGYEWISAGGDTKKVSSARDRITHAFTGLVIVIGAWSLLAVVGQFFGFDILVNPRDVVNNLGL